MEEKKPSKDILNKIKEDQITPKTYFQVYWKNYVFWIVWSVIMIFGAISFSLLILNVLDIRPDFLRELGIGHYLRLLMGTAPYLWIILVLIAFGTGYFAMRKTRSGYRYSIIFITTIIVLVISMVGAVLHFVKFNKHVGERMTNNRQISEVGFPAHERMLRPHEGMLGGEIVEVSDNEITIKGMRGDVWTVLYNNETKIKAREGLQEGMAIIIVGEEAEKGVFNAVSIRKMPEQFKSMKEKSGIKNPVEERRFVE